jgi:hypothetical protein
MILIHFLSWNLSRKTILIFVEELARTVGGKKRKILECTFGGSEKEGGRKYGESLLFSPMIVHVCNHKYLSCDLNHKYLSTATN